MGLGPRPPAAHTALPYQQAPHCSRGYMLSPLDLLAARTHTHTHTHTHTWATGTAHRMTVRASATRGMAGRTTSTCTQGELARAARRCQPPQ